MQKKRVMVFGTFDLLHPGHLFFLKKAAAKGDELVVVVTRDSRALAENGKTPYFNERERKEMVSHLVMVDRVVLGDAPGRWSMIARIKPDLICVGHDQKIPKDVTVKCARIASKNRSRFKSQHIREYYARHKIHS